MSHQVTFRAPLHPIHFARTFSLQSLGRYDPTAEQSHHHFRKAFFYRGSPSALEFRRADDHLETTAFGANAPALAEETALCLAQQDHYATFQTPDTGIQRLHWQLAGLRLLRFPWLYETTCSTILQQRIRTVDAMRAWRRITQRWGAEAPLGLRAFPPHETLAQIPSFQIEALDIDIKRTRALLKFAQESKFHPLRPDMTFSQLREHLLRIPGIGPWTTESVLGYGAGDPDAAIPGDLHLPHLVCYALAGEPEGSDERMMELLDPFRGHRFRIIRLLYESRLTVPRHRQPTPHPNSIPDSTTPETQL